MEDRRLFFDRTTSNVIKGIALIMMFIHHFFTFPEWWGEGISYPFIERIAPYICEPFRICVPIFCFLTGYFYFFNPNKNLKYSLKKITDILFTYWTIFLLFAFLACVCAGYNYNMDVFVRELFGFPGPTMCFCWYVVFYYSFMAVFPFISKILRKTHCCFDCCICFLLVPLLCDLLTIYASNDFVYLILQYMRAWFPCVLCGYLFAKYSCFEKMKRFFKSGGIMSLVYLLVILAVAFLRKYEPTMSLSFSTLPIIHIKPITTINMDIIYAPLFIFSLYMIRESFSNQIIDNVIGEIGKKSLLMWFISCGFYNNCRDIFQPILYKAHNPIIVLVVGLLICYVLAILLNYPIEMLIKIKNKFGNFIQGNYKKHKA